MTTIVHGNVLAHALANIFAKPTRLAAALVMTITLMTAPALAQDSTQPTRHLRGTVPASSTSLLMRETTPARKPNTRVKQTRAKALHHTPAQTQQPARNICADFGAGFVRVEGSNTCMRIGGHIAVGGATSIGAR